MLFWESILFDGSSLKPLQQYLQASGSFEQTEIKIATTFFVSMMSPILSYEVQLRNLFLSNFFDKTERPNK